MRYFDTSKTPRRPLLSAWCPACRETQPCSPQQRATDQQSGAAYICDTCQQATHEPVLRLTMTPRAEVSPAA